MDDWILEVLCRHFRVPEIRVAKPHIDKPPAEYEED